MKATDKISLKNVQEVYSGAEGKLWQLIMGRQIHIGGMASSMDLAGKAGIKPATRGVDFCCCSGGSMRFLVRFFDVEFMCGIDATKEMIELGKIYTNQEKLDGKIKFVEGDVCKCPFEDNIFDFVWGEDAWCYVYDKNMLISQAARVVKPNGIIAFTDWIEGPAGLSDIERRRFLTFMKFPNIQDLNGYRCLLEKNGLEVVLYENTGRFAEHVDLYLMMLEKQFTYDALNIIGFDMKLMDALKSEMLFMQDLAHQGKIAQGLFVARKK